MTFVNVSQNFEDAILDLHKGQLTKQQQKTTQKHKRVKVEKQKQIKINQIIEEWRYKYSWLWKTAK